MFVSENLQNFTKGQEPKQPLGLGLKHFLIVLHYDNSQTIWIVKAMDEEKAWTSLIKKGIYGIFYRSISGNPEDPWSIDKFKGRFDATTTTEIDLSGEVTELDLW